jgi:hypothetical protein
MVRTLQKLSPEFAEIWDAHEVGVRHSKTKRFDHPVVGELELYCEVIDNRDQKQIRVVFTATPGSESAEKLQLLSVLGSQTLDPAR